MGWLIFLIIAVAVVAGVFWAKKNFRNEIDRAKRINRANKNQSPGRASGPVASQPAAAFRARLSAWNQ